MSAANVELGTKGTSWHVSGHLSDFVEAARRDDAGSVPDQALIAFISGPMPTMFITRVRL